MGQPARHEIERHAKNEFAVAQERIAVKHAKKWRRVLAQVSANGNSGGYAPALTESKAKHVRKQIIALADAYVTTFDFFGVPSDEDAVRSLEAGAQQIAAGSSSAVMGELDLIQGRIRVPLPKIGSNVYREIHRSMQSALNTGKLRLRRQRIKFDHSRSPSQQTVPPVSRASSTETGTNPLVGNSASVAGAMVDASYGMWSEYRAWFNARLESLESMAARFNPKHLPEDEQEAQMVSTAAMRRSFDEIAEFEYSQWMEGGIPHAAFFNRLTKLQKQVLEASLKLWSLGSDVLRQWYEKDCQPRAKSALSGRVERWEHRARTTEIVRHLSLDRGRAFVGLIGKLAKLTAEEDQKVPNLQDKLRLQVYVNDGGHRFEGGYTGDFLERARLAFTDVGLELRAPSGIPPLDFCLRILLRELVCEREPISAPQIERLNDEQLSRYLWAPYSGNSITPDSGQILNPCEALKWYCQRLRTLSRFDLANGRISKLGKKRVEAITKSDVNPTVRKGRRSAWLKNRLARHASWTSDLDIAQAGGPTYNTIQRYRSGRKSTRDVYVRRLLAKVFTCDISEVPD